MLKVNVIFHIKLISVFIMNFVRMESKIMYALKSSVAFQYKRIESTFCRTIVTCNVNDNSSVAYVFIK